MPAPDQDPPRPGPDPGQVPLRPGRDPGGRVAYLPPKAARARKLILRSQLGRGWIVAAALFGLVILAAGVLFLTRDGHPGAPWVRVAALSALPDGAVAEVAGPAGQVVVVDRRGGGLRAFLAPPGALPGAGGRQRVRPPLRRPALGPHRRPGQQPPRRPGGPSPAAPGHALVRGRRPVRQPGAGPALVRSGRPSLARGVG